MHACTETLPSRFIDSALPTYAEYKRSLTLTDEERTAVEEAARASKERPRQLRATQPSPRAATSGAEGVAPTLRTPYQKAKETLSAYEREINRLKSDLSRTREDWMHTFSILADANHRVDALEDEALMARLRVTLSV